MVKFGQNQHFFICKNVFYGTKIQKLSFVFCKNFKF